MNAWSHFRQRKWTIWKRFSGPSTGLLSCQRRASKSINLFFFTSHAGTAILCPQPLWWRRGQLRMKNGAWWSSPTVQHVHSVLVLKLHRAFKYSAFTSTARIPVFFWVSLYTCMPLSIFFYQTYVYFYPCDWYCLGQSAQHFLWD